MFITGQGHVKILDFGLAKWVEDRPQQLSAALTAQAPTEELTGRGITIGTIAYMSPERALGKELDARADIFSLGVVLYEMATGNVPFKGATLYGDFRSILHKVPVFSARLNPELPEELGHIIGKPLEKDREVRYQSARESLADLKRLKRARESGSAFEDRTVTRELLLRRRALLQ